MVAVQVAGQDDGAVVRLHLLQEVGDLNIGVAVVSSLISECLPEEGVDFVE
jgi:hypothetical protein